jgi:hybrid cluster-associated redox disulfide protein
MPAAAITADSTVEEVLARFPATARTFVALGLPCFTCGEPTWGTVGELCQRHRRDPAAVLAELNRAARARRNRRPAPGV